MYRVLVVEDEPPILRGISSMIGNLNPAFTVTGQALNGEDAIRILAESPIDVVFTDINMPIVDGVQLMRHIHENYPNIPTIVISGYKEFAYAKSALQYGALDYLLKPIQQDQLADLLARIHKQLKENEDEDDQRALQDLLFFHVPAEQLRLPVLQGQPVYLLLACAGSLPLRYPYDGMLPGEEYWRGAALADTCKTLLPSTCRFWAIPGQTTAEFIAVCLPEPAPDTDFRDYAERLFEGLNHEEIPVSLAVSAPMKAWDSLPQTLGNLRERLYRDARFSRPFLLLPDTPPAPELSFQPQDLEDLLAMPILQKDYDLFAKVLTSLFDELKRHDLTQANVEYVLAFIFLSLQREFPTIRDSAAVISEIIANSYRYDDLLAELLAITRDDFQHKQSSENKAHLAQEIADFLTDHITEPITNQMLSSRFGLAPSYISRLFKSQTGVTPLDFILHKRIAMAKDLLLAHPDMIVKDIAQAVGYPDALYFSRVFKRETSMNPSQFRAESEASTQ